MATNAIKFWKQPKKNLNLGSLRDDKAKAMNQMSLHGVKNKGAVNQTYGPSNRGKMGL